MSAHTNIISLMDERQAREPHTVGPATCLNCQHQWTAIIPTGYLEIDCPECGSGRGVRDGLVEPADSDGKVFTCAKCECQQFMITTRYAMCQGCGNAIWISEIFDAAEL